MVLRHGEGHELLQRHAIFGIDVEQRGRGRGQSQPLLHHVDADEEGGGDRLLGHAPLPHRLESAILVERMQRRTLVVLGERDFLDEDAACRVRHDARHRRGPGEALPRFSILKDYHGLIFSRNGRLIDVQTRTPWTSFINNDRYIKVEVEFSATLGEAFGVTTSKQQVTVSQFIWDRLREAGLPKAIEQLRNKVKEAKAERRQEALSPGAGEQRLSERAMTIAGAMGSAGSEQNQWNLALRVSPYQLEFEHLIGQPFFRVGRENGARTLHLNTAHRFFVEMYDSRISTPELRSALEILLFSLGDVMLEGPDDDRQRVSDQLQSWSKRLDLALAMWAEHLTVGDGMDVGVAAWPDELA